MVKISDDLNHNEITEQEARKRICVLLGVSNRFKVKRVSSDGVFFRCDNCGHEPKLESDTDDLLQMNFCPKCGVDFE